MSENYIPKFYDADTVVDSSIRDTGTLVIIGNPVSSLVMVGIPTVPTAEVGTNTEQIASTAFVHASISLYQPLDADLTALSQLTGVGYAHRLEDGTWSLESVSWGSIGGTLANQTDLVEALNSKANTADLGDSATKDVGTTTGTVAAGDDARIVAGGTALQPAGSGASLTGITQSQVGGLTTALSLKADLVDGTVPASQLPSYVDDIIEVANYAALPATGEAGKIYVTLDTNVTYRWSGAAYVEISASLALGETSSTAYRGDRGKTAYDHSQDTTSNPHAVTKAQVGLGNVDNTSDANKPVSTAQATAINAQVFAAVALTNPYSATTPLTPRYLGDIAINTTSLEIWQAQSAAAAATSWNIVSRGYYGGVVLPDAHAFNYNGFFTCLFTAANVPDATENWLFIQGNSNLGTTEASLLGIGLTTGQLRYQLKSASVWGAWTDKVTPVEISKLAGIGATTVKAQLDAKAPLASPALTGIPTAPTASSRTSNTQLATTAFSQRLKRRYGGHTGPLVAHRNYLNSTTWLSSTSAADNQWRSVCWAAELGLFCAVANSGMGNRVMTSPDGITWTTRTSAADNQWYAVCWSPELGLFCAVSYDGTGNRVMTSPDGITWTTRTSAANNQWFSVCWSPELGLFCAVALDGTGNRVMTSPDGITWTTRTSAADNQWRSVCWAAELGLFCAVSYDGSGNRVMTSPDGITWTLRTSAADNQWRSVCWSPELGLFCAVSYDGAGNRVMTSISSWSMSYRTT